MLDSIAVLLANFYRQQSSNGFDDETMQQWVPMLYLPVNDDVLAGSQMF